MDCRAFAAPKGLRPRRRVKPGNDDLMAAGSAYRKRRVHLSEGLVDDRFSIVIGDASDGIVYFHAAPLHVAVMPIRSRLFRFLVF
jgi:hypothetical protein